MQLDNKIARLWLASKKAEMHSLEMLFELAQLIGQIRKMIHFLQLERGASVLFLVHQQKNSDINYRHYRQCFCNERDTFNQLLEKWLDSSEGKVLAGGVFINLAKVLETFDHALYNTRRQVDGCEISSVQAAKSISAVIKTLINVIVEMTEVTQEPKISKLMVALVDVINAKELAGQERALGVYVIASSSKKDAELEDQRLGLIDMQGYYLNSFADFAVKETRNEFNRVMEYKGLDDYRQKFQDPQFIGIQAAEEWFKVCTARIELLQNLEEHMVQSLQLLCAQKLHNADELMNRDEQWLSENIDGEVLQNSAAGAASILMEKLKQQGSDLKRTQVELSVTKQTLLDQKIIQQAKAKMMKHFRLSEEEAHRKMQQAAMHQDIKLIDLAKNILSKK